MANTYLEFFSNTNFQSSKVTPVILRYQEKFKHCCRKEDRVTQDPLWNSYLLLRDHNPVLVLTGDGSKMLQLNVRFLIEVSF